MIKLGIGGVCGKMGRRIYELASLDKDFEVTLALEKKGILHIGKELGKIKISSNPDGIFLVDVFIDFTTPEATETHLDFVTRYKKALVLGTTGLSESQMRKIEDASKVIPIVLSPNMSVGVNVLFDILPKLAEKLGEDYKVEIIEAHHETKRDAPSGTARKMGEILSRVIQKDISIHSIRLGDIVGDHTVIFCGNSERIEIKHQAHSRDVFARGALKAAKWIFGRPAGLYSMHDILV
ncbi:MAG: 4-hydroxy-tetrahydrodipicolinate reductase [Candidatus Omnitrophica bacterium]|nr:4-hydroxy-tetrahydrodipicolinate reductase [Candidatus Omnitrophota bacterium]